MTDTVRIAKYISDAGAASRRAAEKMIADGRVTVNGRVVDTPVFFVGADDIVCLDGNQISARIGTEVYMFHKPLNTITTTADTRGRRTIYDVLPKKYKHLKYVGRLDYKTTGLLLLTNDGELARKLTLPSSNIPRVYIARVARGEHDLDAARRGVTVDGIHYAPMKITKISDTMLKVEITEGKKNEVRIVLGAIGAPVRELHRVSFGGLKLGDLKPGKIIQLNQKTIDAITKYI